jgi:ribosomal RNA methyltransferase Nop2
LSERGIHVDKIGDWTKEGLKVFESEIPIGATPEYLTGKYMIQSASSFVPVMALCPQPNETILDMAAAPGGKTTHIGQRMQNTGTLFANDLRADRCKSLMANIHRLGVQNAVVLNYDGLQLAKVMPKLDRVLLDAPCTGSGIISRDNSIKLKRTQKDFEEHSELQKKLLLTAIDMVDAESKTGGIIVYSTCSIAVEENEQVVDYALKARKNIRLVGFEEQVPFGVKGFKKFRGLTFDPTVEMTRRYYPHVHNMDGFFVAKFEKFSNEIPNRGKKDNSRKNPHQVWGEEKWAEMSEKVIHYPEEKTEKKEKVLTKKEKKALRKEKRTEEATKKKTELERRKVKKQNDKKDKKPTKKTKVVTEKKEVEAPVVTEKKEVVEKKEIATPEKKEVATPEKKIVTPKKKVVVSNKKAVVSKTEKVAEKTEKKVEVVAESQVAESQKVQEEKKVEVTEKKVEEKKIVSKKRRSSVAGSNPTKKKKISA